MKQQWPYKNTLANQGMASNTGSSTSLQSLVGPANHSPSEGKVSDFAIPGARPPPRRPDVRNRSRVPPRGSYIPGYNRLRHRPPQPPYPHYRFQGRQLFWSPPRAGRPPFRKLYPHPRYHRPPPDRNSESNRSTDHAKMLYEDAESGSSVYEVTYEDGTPGEKVVYNYKTAPAEEPGNLVLYGSEDAHVEQSNGELSYIQEAAHIEELHSGGHRPEQYRLQYNNWDDNKHSGGTDHLNVAEPVADARTEEDDKSRLEIDKTERDDATTSVEYTTLKGFESKKNVIESEKVYLEAIGNEVKALNNANMSLADIQKEIQETVGLKMEQKQEVLNRKLERQNALKQTAMKNYIEEEKERRLNCTLNDDGNLISKLSFFALVPRDVLTRDEVYNENFVLLEEEGRCFNALLMLKAKEVANTGSFELLEEWKTRFDCVLKEEELIKIRLEKQMWENEILEEKTLENEREKLERERIEMKRIENRKFEQERIDKKKSEKFAKELANKKDTSNQFFPNSIISTNDKSASIKSTNDTSASIKSTNNESFNNISTNNESTNNKSTHNESFSDKSINNKPTNNKLFNNKSTNNNSTNRDESNDLVNNYNYYQIINSSSEMISETSTERGLVASSNNCSVIPPIASPVVLSEISLVYKPNVQKFDTMLLTNIEKRKVATVTNSDENVAATKSFDSNKRKFDDLLESVSKKPKLVEKSLSVSPVKVSASFPGDLRSYLEEKQKLFDEIQGEGLAIDQMLEQLDNTTIMPQHTRVETDDPELGIPKGEMINNIKNKIESLRKKKEILTQMIMNNSRVAPPRMASDSAITTRKQEMPPFIKSASSLKVVGMSTLHNVYIPSRSPCSNSFKSCLKSGKSTGQRSVRWAPDVDYILFEAETLDTKWRSKLKISTLDARKRRRENTPNHRDIVADKPYFDQMSRSATPQVPLNRNYDRPTQSRLQRSPTVDHSTNSDENQQNR